MRTWNVTSVAAFCIQYNTQPLKGCRAQSDEMLTMVLVHGSRPIQEGVQDAEI